MPFRSHNARRREPSKLTEMRFEYAWKWFDFHADQRTKMFNFMLVGLGVLTTSVVAALKDCLFVEALGISMGAVVLAAVFWRLDNRNRYLYRMGLDILIDTEKKVVFGDGVTFEVRPRIKKDFGIARRIALEEQRARDKLSPHRFMVKKIWNGQHRYLMPTVAWVFILIFLFCIGLSVYGLRHPSCKPSGGADTATACAGSSTSGASTAHASGPLSGPSTGQDANGLLQHFNDNGPLVVGSTSLSQPWFFTGVIGGLLLMAAGAWALSKGHKGVGGAALVAGAITSVLPHFSVPLSAQFKIDPTFEGKLADKIGIDMKLDRRLEAVRQSQATILASVRLTGFPPGIESLDCNDASNRDSISKVNGAITDALSRQLQPIVFVVGSADRMELTPHLRQRFESNSGLARARANAVERCLKIADSDLAAGGPRAPRVITVTSGPGYVPAIADEAPIVHQMMAEDRGVSVLVLGFPATGH